MSNLYEILEVSENASKEVIEKAYHVLAKKYHPDLQQENKKKTAEDKMKQINEAYEILSNEAKRKEYDLLLKEQREEQKILEEIEKIDKQENIQNDNLQKLRQEEIERQKNIQTQEEYNNMQKLQDEMKRAYNQAYNDYLRSLRI